MFILINNGDVFDGTFEQFENSNHISFDINYTEEDKKMAVMCWAKLRGFKCDFVTKRVLFNSDGQYTHQAREIDHLHAELVVDIFKKYTALGYSVREISHVLMSHIPLLESRFILDMRKEIKAANPISINNLKAYEMGMCAGDTAFRIGGKMLYYQTPDGIMKRNGIGCSPVEAAISKETGIEYQTAMGYIEGYTSAERGTVIPPSCKK